MVVMCERAIIIGVQNSIGQILIPCNMIEWATPAEFQVILFIAEERLIGIGEFQFSGWSNLQIDVGVDSWVVRLEGVTTTDGMTH